MDEMQFWQIRSMIERMTGEIHMLSRQIHEMMEMTRQHPMDYYNPPGHTLNNPPDYYGTFHPDDIPMPSNMPDIDELIKRTEAAMKQPTKKDDGWESV